MGEAAQAAGTGPRIAQRRSRGQPLAPFLQPQRRIAGRRLERKARRGSAKRQQLSVAVARRSQLALQIAAAEQLVTEGLGAELDHAARILDQLTSVVGSPASIMKG